MSVPADFVTVYRSMDATAKQDAEAVMDMLAARGVAAVMLDDSAPGVPEGAFEVKVAPADAVKAEQWIDENPLPDEVAEVDDSANLDLETVFAAVGTLAEMQAEGIKNLLESNGITTVLNGLSVLPYLPFEVRVARAEADRARELIAEAKIAGPAAADEAELETEKGE
jgi:hypothetical protein